MEPLFFRDSNNTFIKCYINDLHATDIVPRHQPTDIINGVAICLRDTNRMLTVLSKPTSEHVRDKVIFLGKQMSGFKA